MSTPRTTPARATGRLIALGALAGWVAWLAWDGRVPHLADLPALRVFAVVWVVTALTPVVARELAWLGRAVPPEGQRCPLPLSLQAGLLGLLVGTAAGTTPWPPATMAGWWQFWWTMPALPLYADVFVAAARPVRERWAGASRPREASPAR